MRYLICKFSRTSKISSANYSKDLLMTLDYIYSRENRFFSHYSPLLPLLDPEVSANMYYAKLPLLFWAIIAVGSRRYSADPTLLESLTPSLLKLAMHRVPRRKTQPYAIQALLLLVTWPLPIDSLWNDITFTLSGMTMNYALQTGLHYPAHSLDFSQIRTIVDSDAVQRRAQLWAHCVILCSAYVVHPFYTSYQPSNS